MRVTLVVPDEIVEQYKAQTPKDKTLTQVMAERLKAFAAYPPHERVFVLGGKDRQALEAIFQTTINSVPDLITKVKNLGLLQIGPVIRTLTAGELCRLRDQANFHGWTPEKWAEFTCGEAMDIVFNRF